MEDLTPYLLVHFAIAALTLGSGVWLMLHLRDVARLFRDEPDIAVGPGPRQASKATTWTMLALFNMGWIAALAFWIIVIPPAP
jgi:hypothetical protein